MAFIQQQFNKQYYWLKLQLNWRSFYEAFSVPQQKKQAGEVSERTPQDLLYDHLGHEFEEQDHAVDNLLSNLNQLLRGPAQKRESRAGTDMMLEFIGLHGNYPLNFFGPSIPLLPIEQKFKDARDAMLDYRYEVVGQLRKQNKYEIPTVTAPSSLPSDQKTSGGKEQPRVQKLLEQLRQLL